MLLYFPFPKGICFTPPTKLLPNDSLPLHAHKILLYHSLFHVIFVPHHCSSLPAVWAPKKSDPPPDNGTAPIVTLSSTDGGFP